MSTISTEQLELVAADGHRLSAYLAKPAGEARGSVIVLQEIFGVNSHIRDVCDRYAAAGYTALAPALFDRQQRGVELGYDQEGIARGMQLRNASPTDKVMLDVEAALTALGGPGKAATVGYCWGGMLAWISATELPVAGAIAYYGGGIGNLLDVKLGAPVLLHFGEHDKLIPLTVAAQLREQHPSAITHVYPADHGFNCDQRSSYHEASAVLALRRSLGFLDALF